MLDSYRRGYAVMTHDLSAFAFESETLEDCKRYCGQGYVIVERIPVVNGFSMTVECRKYYHKWISFHREFNLFQLHIRFWKHYTHKTGEVVFKNEPFL